LNTIEKLTRPESRLKQNPGWFHKKIPMMDSDIDLLISLQIFFTISPKIFTMVSKNACLRVEAVVIQVIH
jgi:hypothetical protein